MAAGTSQASKRDEAKDAYGKGEFSKAIDLYSALIDDAALEDDFLHIYYSNRAACYQNLRQYQTALGDAESCVATKPSFMKGHIRLASIFSSLGRYKDAAHTLERALQMEPQNSTIRNSLDTARRKAGMSSYSSGDNSSGAAFNFDGVKTGLRKVLTQLMSTLAHASTTEKLGYGIALLLVIYYIGKTIYRFFFPTYFYYDDYDYDYSSYGGGGYGGYGGYSRGLSWPMWFAVMGGAYYLPPRLPGVFGQYAQPFFGMNWTTFMWLLRMLTSGGGGGFGASPFGFGGRRRRYY